MDDFLGRNDGQVRCQGMLHIVAEGDTLYKISRQYGVPLARIMYANPYVDVYNLQAGDEICVPVMTPRPLTERGGEHRGEMPQAQPDMRNSYPEESRIGEMPPAGEMPSAWETRPGEMQRPVENRPEGMPQTGRTPQPPMPYMEDGGMAPPMEESFANDLPEPEGMAQPMMGMCPGTQCPNVGETMPWDNTGVSEQMMDEYLMGMPRRHKAP